MNKIKHNNNMKLRKCFLVVLLALPLLVLFNHSNANAINQLTQDYSDQQILDFANQIKDVNKDNCWEIDSILKSNPGIKDAVIDNKKPVSEAVDNKKNGSSGQEPDCPNVDQSNNECSIGGAAGWLLCPISELIASSADGAFGLLNDKLITNHSLLNPKTLEGSATYHAWKIIRNLANILFLFSIILIVFSQITSYGLSSYSAKKMLPKIIVSIILVNLSFYIIQILVDLSNLSGDAIINLFNIQKENLILKTSSGSPGSFSYIVNGLLLGTITYQSGILGEGFLSLVLPLIASFILIVITTLILLLTRESVVVLLTMFSPLFLCLMVFSKSEQAYKIWKKTLLACLILYPTLAALFGAGKLIGGILENTNDPMTNVMALLIRVLPLIALPSLIQKTISSVPLLGDKLNSLMGKVKSGGMNFTKKSSLYQNSANKRSQKMDRIRRGEVGKYGNGAALAGLNRALNKTSSGRSRLAKLKNEEMNQIIKGGSNFTQEDNDALLKYGDNTNIKHLSEPAKSFLYSEGMVGFRGKIDTKKVKMMNAINQANQGNLSARAVNGLFINDLNNLPEDQMTKFATTLDQISTNKGRLDTSGAIRGYLGRDKSKNWTTSESINSIEDRFKTATESELKNLNHQVFESGSLGSGAYRQMYTKNKNSIDKINKVKYDMSSAAKSNIDRINSSL